MSYGIIRIQKFTSGSVRGIDIHDNRLKEFSHTNQDIDFSKSENNYVLKKSDNSFYNSVQNRIKELNLPKAVRKDAVVMSQALVTSDRSFFDGLDYKTNIANGSTFGESKIDYTKDFFERAYEFIENRYGKENIISATVHLDEKTPHMHVNFVPVTADGRLCAKDLLNKREMQSLQNDAYAEIFKLFDLQRGEIREEKRRHLDVAEFKMQTKIDELMQEANQKAEQVIASAEEEILTKMEQARYYIQETERTTSEMRSIALLDVQKAKDSIKLLKDEQERLKRQIEGYKGIIQTANDIDDMGKKSLVGGKVTLTADEMQRLKEQAKAYWAARGRADQLERELIHANNLTGKIRPLQEEVQTLKKDLAEKDRAIQFTKTIMQSDPELHRTYSEAGQRLQSRYKEQQAVSEVLKPKKSDYEH